MCGAQAHVCFGPKADIGKRILQTRHALLLPRPDSVDHERLMQRLVAAALLMMTPNVWAAEPQTLQVLGQSGALGEWELTANVTATGTQKEFSGPLVMKHVGICTVDGPEQKTGNIKLHFSASSRVKATLLIDGVACTYAGRKSDSYGGLLRCPDQRDVPLLMWLK